MSSNRIELPGFGLPVNFMPEKEDAPRGLDSSRKLNGGEIVRFPSAILDWAPPAFSVRERNMLAFMDRITDKPEWRRKVFDETILQKWKSECLAREDWDFSEKMFSFCVAELQEKAKENEEDGIATTLNVPATIAKSDTIVPEDLKEALRAAVQPLENVPDKAKDWHPNSNEQVLDLVHPSLFPVIYGRTKILPDSNAKVDLRTAIFFTGKGETIDEPSDEEVVVVDSQLGTSGYGEANLFWSKRFQWLPCEVSFSESEPGVKIDSYINNLHPVHQEHLYPVIERYIAKAIPLWNVVLRNVNSSDLPRIHLTEAHDYEFEYGGFETRQDEKPEDPKQDDDSYWDFRTDWERAHRTLIQPEPEPFDAVRDRNNERGVAPPLDLRTAFAEKGLQVIVKLANIHLTPAKPSYSGGSWHVEGMLNEHICATALYYYDSDNIGESWLAFRQRCDTEGPLFVAYDQDDYAGAEELYDIRQNDPAIQLIGDVETKEGRMLAFPNVVQHRVMPFELVDKTKPGHRKILALFLVDPHVRVISSANVPPQQLDWWAEALRSDDKLSGSVNKLPNELFEATINNVTDFPISLEEAKKLREELMSERTVYVEEVNKAVDTFFFCEH